MDDLGQYLYVGVFILLIHYNFFHVEENLHPSDPQTQLTQILEWEAPYLVLRFEATLKTSFQFIV